MSAGFQEGAKKVGGGARTGANDAGYAQPVTTTMGGAGNPYGSGAGAGFAGGAMNSGYGSMGPGAMGGYGAGPITTTQGVAGGKGANGAGPTTTTTGANGTRAAAGGAGKPAGAAGGPNMPPQTTGATGGSLYGTASGMGGGADMGGYGNSMYGAGDPGFGGPAGYGQAGPGAAYGAGGGGPGGYGSMYGPGGSAFGGMGGPSGGYGPGGYAMGGSMYGGSMYGGGDMVDENIVVSKVFSSRRDLDSMASGLDFPRRFDSNWPSYRSSGNSEPPSAKPSGFNTSAYQPEGKPSMIESGNGSRDLPGIGPTGDAAVPATKPAPSNGTALKATEAQTPAAKPATTAPAPATSPKKSVAPPPTAPAAKSPQSKAPPATTTKPPATNASRGGVEAVLPPKPVDLKEQARRQQQRENEEEERRRRGQAAAQALKDEQAKQEALRKAAEEQRLRAIEEEAARRKAAAAPPVRPAQPAQPSRPAPPVQPERQRAVEAVPAQDDDDDIPIIRDDLKQQQQQQQQPQQQRRPTPQQPPQPVPSQREDTGKAPTPKAATPQNAAPKPTPGSQAQPVVQQRPAAQPQETAAPSVPRTRTPPPTSDERPKSRPRSRPQRTMSRTSDIDLVEVPKGEEVQDDLAAKVLTDPAKEALEQARLAREKERERQRALRAEQRAVQEEAERQRELLAQQRREQQAIEDRKRREEIARMDEERRKARQSALEAREREKEEEKRRFEEAKAAEAEKEKARLQAIVEGRQRALAQEKEDAAAAGVAEERPERAASRPRSRRSRPTSALRGGIPEQPPDVEGSQIKDTMADELADSGTRSVTPVPRKRGNTPLPTPGTIDARRVPNDNRRSATPSQRATPAQRSTPGSYPAKAPTPSGAAARQTPTPKAPTPSTTSPATREVKAASPKSGSSTERSGNTPQTAATANDRNTPEKEPERNPINTLVVVEKLNESNRAVTYTDDTVTWCNYPVRVSEVKDRGEDDFSYRSEVVHKLCDNACRGYNVAALSAEAPNTAARAESPVWPVLVRIVNTVLRSKQDQDGNLKSGFLFEWSLAYFNDTNAKDLLVEDQPFRPLAVKPSPVSGPRLTEMTYVPITDASSFETRLTAALSRAINDPVVSSMTSGFIGAYLTLREEFFENGKKDVCFSSVNVIAAGSDMKVYDDALSRTRGPYGQLLHVDVLAPCYTVFMVNLSDDDTRLRSQMAPDTNVHNELVTIFRTLERMTTTENLALRSGSVRRFVHYIRKNQNEVKQRLAQQGDRMEPEKRAKLEKYLVESEAIFREYYAMVASDTPTSDPHREL